MSTKLMSIIVTVTDDKLKEIRQVADQLSAKGMTVDRILPITGVITGSSPSKKLPGLSKVGGVLSVENEAIAEISSD